MVEYVISEKVVMACFKVLPRKNSYCIIPRHCRNLLWLTRSYKLCSS